MERTVLSRNKNSNFFIWACLTILIMVYLSMGFSENRDCDRPVSKTENCLGISSKSTELKCEDLGQSQTVNISCILNEKVYIINFERGKLFLVRKDRAKSLNSGENKKFTIRCKNKKKGIYLISSRDSYNNELFMCVDYSSENPLKKDIIFKKSICPEKDNSLKIKIIEKNGEKIIKFFDGSFLCSDSRELFSSGFMKKSILGVSFQKN